MLFRSHECDILASRADLDYIIPNELKVLLGENVKVELPDIDTYVITFGKHSGKTLPQIAEVDPGYISWAKENMTREPVRTLLMQM